METVNAVRHHPEVSPLHALTIQKACKLAGGPLKLAGYLHAPVAAVARWLKGEQRPPARVFVDCVDLVLFHERHLSN